MGSQCCRLVCRPFKKQMTIQDKVKNLYNVGSGDKSEHQVKIQVYKLNAYLKDRADKIKPCIEEIKKVWAAALHEEMTQDDLKIINITLLALLTLTQYRREFLPMTYQMVYMLMMHPRFGEVKKLVYEILLQCTTTFPDDNPPYLEDIMIELVSYCSNPKNVSKNEILVLSAMGFSLRSKFSKGSYLKWETVIDLALIRIIKNKDNDLDEEMELVKNFASFMVGNAGMVHLFIGHIVDFLHKNQGWNENSQLIFDSILLCKEYGHPIFYSEIFKTIIYYMHKILSEDKSNVKNILNCAFSILKEPDSNVSTMLYNETFKDVILMLLNEEVDHINEFLQKWSQKADNQSFISFVKSILTAKQYDRPYIMCIKQLKAIYEKELNKSKPPHLFVQGTLQIIFVIVSDLYEEPSKYLLKVLSFLIFKLKRRFSFKQNEIYSLNLSLLKMTDNAISMPIDESMKIFKHCLKSWLSLVIQESSENLSLMLMAVFKLRRSLNQAQNIQNNLCLALCIYSILKAISITYKLDKVKSFVDRSASQYLQKESFRPFITEDGKFMKIMDATYSLFDKENINSIKKNTVKFTSNMLNIEEKCDLPRNAEDGEINIGDIKESRDFDPLGFVPSESDVSSMKSSENFDRGIELGDIKPELIETDYAKALGAIEDEDSNFVKGLLETS
ncbi:unnamed protein product [Blepharisma stoltei]|uniref:Uncharacterized protein n=1 Tax=Blepharisma stoltei TaxID=1481888 RepID=A0AAU9K7I1_9CILI|nr:unnamed protein product [Blepharisma stoltei]